ncbi:hypothetical protein, partial [Butyricicoccus pullicaecorum]
AVQTPERLLSPVWPLPRSLATTSGISVDFFSSPYLDVSVQAVPYVNLWIQLTLTEYCSAGFPHSEIFGSKPICGSPKLIAACRVLHRLSVPRHSPCALYSLTYWSRMSDSSVLLLQELGKISVLVISCEITEFNKNPTRFYLANFVVDLLINLPNNKTSKPIC